jgi:hypothetical protein
MLIWKSILIDLSFVLLYMLFYKFLGFELTVILALSMIFSNLAKKDYPKKQQPLRTFYTTQKKNIRF